MLRETMPLRHFYQMSHVLSLKQEQQQAEVGNDDSEKLAPLGGFYEACRSRLSRLYELGHNLTVDEHFVPS